MPNYTADINSELNKIKNAKYGEEVRDSIVSAIRKINESTGEFLTIDDVNLLLLREDLLYKYDLVQTAVSSLSQGGTINSSGATVTTDGHYLCRIC